MQPADATVVFRLEFAASSENTSLFTRRPPLADEVHERACVTQLVGNVAVIFSVPDWLYQIATLLTVIVPPAVAGFGEVILLSGMFDDPDATAVIYTPGGAVIVNDLRASNPALFVIVAVIAPPAPGVDDMLRRYVSPPSATAGSANAASSIAISKWSLLYMPFIAYPPKQLTDA